MRLTVVFALLSLPALALSGCDASPGISDPPSLATPDGALLSRGPGAGALGALQNFVAPHDGSQEVPANDSRARGQAVFQLSKDGTELHFRLLVANIENVLQAHIHCGPPGANGPVLVFLYPSAPPAELIPGRTSGVLNEGVITEANVIPRPDSEECPGGVATLDDVVQKMRAGGAYSNVHTQQVPAGEIRGAIVAAGPHH